MQEQDDLLKAKAGLDPKPTPEKMKLPDDLFAALRADTADLQAAGWRRPLSRGQTMSMRSPAPPGLFELQTYSARSHVVVLDSDLAAVYGVETRVFNQALRRNLDRFPADFAFQITASEWAALRSQSVTLKPTGHGQHRKYAPWVFTEHGAVMATSILNSPRALSMSVHVVRVFVRLRRELLTNSTLETRLEKIEKSLLTHDVALQELFAKIRPLLLPPRGKNGRRRSRRGRRDQHARRVRSPIADKR